MKLTGPLTYRQLFAFFIPLGVSASLTSITHVIINGTLSRGDQAAFIIACYAVAFGLFGILERPVLIFRQAASALVTDLNSFKLLRTFLFHVLTVIMILCAMIGFTPLGEWLYIQLFNATPDMVKAINSAFLVITLVIICSAFRSFYQGIIISQLATNWLTIGVVIRLVGMFLVSYLFVSLDLISSATGSWMFFTGMFIEGAVSVYKGEQLLRTEYSKMTSPTPLLKRDISAFYFPLAFYFLMQSVLTPIIYILLAKSQNLEMSIASFSLAFSITQLTLGFFMYTHQLVLQFFPEHRKIVIKFVLLISIIPTIFLLILCYSPLGMLFMTKIMGADETLSIATLAVLKFFIVKTLVFPWVDFLNGFLMLKRQTNRMLFAQVANLLVVSISLIILVRFMPQLNGVNGSIAASLGELAGFIIVSIIIYHMTDHYQQRKRKRLLRKRTSS